MAPATRHGRDAIVVGLVRNGCGAACWLAADGRALLVLARSRVEP